jgi:hypothetical protein
MQELAGRAETRHAIPTLPYPDSLESFLQEIRSSCDAHATRNGYLEEDGRNVAGDMTAAIGIAQPNALGKMFYKWLEFQRIPRRVIAVKIAGWVWRLWLTVKG